MDGAKTMMEEKLTAGLDARLSGLQEESFNYFLHEYNPANGLVKDKSHLDWPASIAAVGMALTVYPVGVERGFLPREAAVQRTLASLRFFAASDQSGGPQSTGYKGFYFHFLDFDSGRRVWNSELSSIDTALLLAGALSAASYFQREDADEREIRELADMLYRRADWQWMRNGGRTMSHGWKPERGFLRWRWEGYDEAMILYVLAMGSPTFPVPAECYTAWTETYEWKRIYGIDYLYAGPLFIHQMSHVWIDFRDIRDAFMRSKDCDYFENSRRATLVQQQYAMQNPMGYRHYGEFCWGITASDGPGKSSRKVAGVARRFYDYIARGVPYGPDDGTLAPWAALACLPFAPEIVLPTMHYFSSLQLDESNRDGFKASFNPTFPAGADKPFGWVSPCHFGINEGPTVLMLENYRSGLPWALMRQCPYIVHGLRQAGFTGGWLDMVRPAS
jgi:hypothetical protein